MLKGQEKFYTSNGKRLVLIAEDEEINREILAEIIREDYDVLQAADGDEALRLIKEHQTGLSIILLDLYMPGINGFELLRILKEDPAFQHIPTIILTADQESEARSLSLGAADFIPKPYPSPGVILARIRRTIELFEDRLTIQTTERDPLTNLYNREFFFHYAELFDQHHGSMETDAIIIDIYHFRVINERFGSAYGDEVLRRTGSSIRDSVADSGGIVCRPEADIFMVYCPHGVDYKTILDNASRCFSDDANSAYIHLRMGIYANVDKTIPIERRFDRAKMAVDMIRNSYTKTIGFYDHSLHEKEVFEQQLVEDFRQALEEHQFIVCYQPKFFVRPEEPVLSSAEALVRWIHPRFGFISPGQFISVFEDNGLIEELDEYVWNEAARQIREWKDKLGFSVPVSVNVSRVDMYDPGLDSILQRILDDHRVGPADILLEITESAYSRDSEHIVEAVGSLRKIGFRIEMDDFGNGYSSLNMLSTLPVDVLKLDMEFIRNVFQNSSGIGILEIIVEIANYLGIPLVAEGVETEEQMQALRGIGCQYIQGYYFSKPLPASEFEAFLLEHRPPADNAASSAVYGLLADPAAPGRWKPAYALSRDISADIARSLSRDYFSIYIVDTRTDVFYEYSSDEAYKSLHIQPAGEDFFELSRQNAKTTVYIEDLPRFLRDFTKENIMGTLKAGETFSMAYRLLIRNQPTYVNLKISRLDENSISRVVVGVSSIDAGTDLQKEDAPFAGISRALAGDYVRIYYLDMQTDGFILFDTRNSGNALQVEKTGDDLFQLIRETAKETMHPDDLEGFLNQFTRENLYEYHAGMRPLQLTYRLYMNGRWNYLKLKAAAPESPDDTHIIIGITNVDEQYRLEQEQKEALRIAKQDSLTGLQNKRAFSEASKVIDDAIRSQSAEPFALVICDMNNLKQINDTLGHSEGDEAIRQAGRTISHIYPNSTVYRIGGDEFAVILRSTDYENREHACKMLQSLNHAHPVGRQIIIAAGMTDYDPARDHSFSQIVNRADAAMYENKRELKK